VRFDHNAYSVPRRWAFRAVTVKGYVDRVEVVAEGQAVARHARSYGRGERVLDPLHYLVALGRKPAALDHAPVYRDWRLPPTFAELRRDLEGRLGPRVGGRHYIRVLQLLAGHPLARVEQAILLCRGRGEAEVQAILAQAEALAARGAPPALSAPGAPVVAVPPPDLAQFNRLLSHTQGGGEGDDATDGPAAAGQPQAAEAADHAGRVRQAGPRGGRQQ
jgi:hypothetical protein